MLSLPNKSPISLIDGLDSLCPDVDYSEHKEPFRFNTSTIVLKDNGRLGFIQILISSQNA